MEYNDNFLVLSTKEVKNERDKIISQVTATSSSSAESEGSAPSPHFFEPDKTLVAESHIVENTGNNPHLH